MKADSTDWLITVVYGPQADADKLLCLHELHALASQDRERWLILGDFDLIYQAYDKNNLNLNRRFMGSFKTTIDGLKLKELCLNGLRFTDDNGQGQDNPTMTRTDRFFLHSGEGAALPDLVPPLSPLSHVRPHPTAPAR